MVHHVKGELGGVMEGTDGGGAFTLCLSVNPAHHLPPDAQPAALQAAFREKGVKGVFDCAEVCAPLRFRVQSAECRKKESC